MKPSIIAVLLWVFIIYQRFQNPTTTCFNLEVYLYLESGHAAQKKCHRPDNVQVQDDKRGA